MSFSLAAGLASEGCAALLVIAESSRDPDLAPFVGGVHLGAAFVVAPRAGRVHLGFLTEMEREEAARTGKRLLTPEDLAVESLRHETRAEAAFWAELLDRGLAAAGVDRGRVALAGRLAAGTVAGAAALLTEKGWRFTDGSRLARLHRRAKGPAEEDDVRRAAAGTCAAFRRIAALLAASEPHDGEARVGGERLTVGFLRREVARTLAGFDLEQPEGNIFASGATGGVPHSVGRDEDSISFGRTLVVDLFPRHRLFADCTRTFCLGAPTAPVAAAHAAVRSALLEAHEALAVGVRGWNLQVAACRWLEAAGHATPLSEPGTRSGYVHGLGHGVGFEIHEYPSFRQQAADEGVLAVGDLFTLEPGLYYPDHREGGFGVRLEDLVLMGENGAENLTPLPYDLDPRCW